MLGNLFGVIRSHMFFFLFFVYLVFSKTVAELKMRFPSLQQNLRSILSNEMERVCREETFLKDEPDRLEVALRRCKKLTGTLVTLKRLTDVIKNWRKKLLKYYFHAGWQVFRSKEHVLIQLLQKNQDRETNSLEIQIR